MKRRLFAGALALALCFGLLPMAALAAEPSTGNWIDVADISWYSEEATEYHISTAEQLAGLAYLVNGGNFFAGKINWKSSLFTNGIELIRLMRSCRFLWIDRYGTVSKKDSFQAVLMKKSMWNIISKGDKNI